MPVGQTIGILVIPLLLGIVFFNGMVMLVSPAWWFALPPYIALRGTLRRDDYMSTRVGRLRIRVLGCVLAGVTGWMIVSFFGIPRALGLRTSGADSPGVPVDWWLCVVPCLGGIGCGVVMLLKPGWWIAKYFQNGRGEISQIAVERIVRIMSLPCIGLGIYFLLQCVDIR